MSFTEDRYDVYELDVATSKKTSETLFKLLFANQSFSSLNDHIVFCTASDLKDLAKQERFKFRNFSISDTGEVWLTVCQPPCDTYASNRECITIKKELRVWEFLWDIISSDLSVCVENEPYVNAFNIHFSMTGNCVTLYNPLTSSNRFIWIPPSIHDSREVVPLCIKCSADFYNKWKNFVATSGSVKQDLGDTIIWEVRLWELFYSYNSAYALCRFTEQELAYLADKYLLTKTYLEGIRLGNWYMHTLNHVHRDIRMFPEITDEREPGALCFSYNVDMPDLLDFKKLLDRDLEGIYNRLVDQKSVEDVVLFFEDILQKKFNIYYREFILGLLAQISVDRNIINEHEYLIAEKEQIKLTALSSRIFVYRLLDKVLHLSDSSTLHLHDGVLKMEVCR